MSGFDELISKVEDYQTDCLNLKKVKFEVSDPFDLVEDWDSYYPYCDEAGIYAIFNENEELLYIGKASNNSSIGSRLGSYFKNDEKGNFSLKHPEGWGEKGKPRFIIGVSVSEPFEAPSLEEYLIYKLQPEINQVGKNIQ
ncbi:MAG: GIY-YIG nuclease family protein [Proteobacteria bacterium]|nr:GIY-YIG nuclease family protein [Pseudomonadota bacterium]